MTKITRMFHERALFFPEHVSTEHVHVNWYLSILRRNICEFMVNTIYHTLAELQTNAGRREIKLETEVREKKETRVRDRIPLQSQLVTKRPKPDDSGVGDRKRRTCSKCGNVHEGPCRSGAICYMYSKDGHMANPRDFRFVHFQLDSSFEV